MPGTGQCSGVDVSVGHWIWMGPPRDWILYGNGKNTIHFDVN